MRARTKATKTEKRFINWAEISKELTNGSDSIRENRIPKKYEGRIEELLSYIKAWEEGTKLFSEAQLKEALGKIDTKTILLVEMGILEG